MTNEQWDAWVAARPAAVAAAMRRYPAWRDGALVCYRSTENPRFHYTIYSLSEHPDGTVSATLVHGTDSTLPGVRTFGQPLAQLIPCQCGAWLPPTDEQVQRTRQRLATYGRTTDPIHKSHLRDLLHVKRGQGDN